MLFLKHGHVRPQRISVILILKAPQKGSRSKNDRYQDERKKKYTYLETYGKIKHKQSYFQMMYIPIPLASPLTFPHLRTVTQIWQRNNLHPSPPPPPAICLRKDLNFQALCIFQGVLLLYWQQPFIICFGFSTSARYFFKSSLHPE